MESNGIRWSPMEGHCSLAILGTIMGPQGVWWQPSSLVAPKVAMSGAPLRQWRWFFKYSQALPLVPFRHVLLVCKGWFRLVLLVIAWWNPPSMAVAKNRTKRAEPGLVAPATSEYPDITQSQTKILSQGFWVNTQLKDNDCLITKKSTDELWWQVV